MHTHAPGPCHVHVTVSCKEQTNHHQPSKCKVPSRQIVSQGAGMHKCVSAGRPGEPSAVAGSQGSHWQQEFTRQKQLYIEGRGRKAGWFSVCLLSTDRDVQSVEWKQVCSSFCVDVWLRRQSTWIRVSKVAHVGKRKATSHCFTHFLSSSSSSPARFPVLLPGASGSVLWHQCTLNGFGAKVHLCSDVKSACRCRHQVLPDFD